jgi:opacity protein-like surface antigen
MSNDEAFVMRSLNILALAGWLALGAAGAAQAADMPAPPPPPAPVEFGGWYLRGDIGGAIGMMDPAGSTFNPLVTVPGFQSDSTSLGNALFLGAGVGYQFNSWFRTDVTGEWRNQQSYRAVESYSDQFGLGCANGRCGDSYYGKLQTNALVMVNGYVDLGTWSGFTPYVGAGVGTGYTRFGPIQDFGTDSAAAGYGIASSKAAWQPAWALMAGVSYAFSPNLALDVGYRYLNLGSFTSNPIQCQAPGVCANEMQTIRVASSDVRVGLRWIFGAPAPVAPPPAPIVRKY